MIIIHCGIYSISGGGSGSSCKTEECQRREKIGGYCFLGLIGFMLLCACIYFCCCDRRGQPRQDNSVFVNLLNQTINQQERSDISPFQSGIWSSRYFQYGSWHGPHQCPLVFDSRSMNVTGTRSDDVGVFTITGIYSNETNRIGLTKTYQAGTGNQSENLGHHVTIQLTWNVQDRQFVGKWYVQTNQYRGQGAFELRYNKRQQFSVHEN
jgi:hypothetical protein